MRKLIIGLAVTSAVLTGLSVALYHWAPWLELSYLEARIDWNCSQAKPDATCLARMRAMGHIWSGMGDLERAKHWYEAAANHGDAVAMFHLAWVYDVEARRDIRVFAQSSAGRMQAQAPAVAAGESVPPMAAEAVPIAAKVAQAVNWYHRSANLGFAPAMNNLGQLYFIGLDRSESLSVAFEWYLQSARSGNPIGAWNVMLAYRAGSGVRPNFPESQRWAVWSSEHTDPADLAWPTLERTTVTGSFLPPDRIAVLRSASIAGVSVRIDRLPPPPIMPLPRFAAANAGR